MTLERINFLTNDYLDVSMGSKIYWIMIVITALVAGGVFFTAAFSQQSGIDLRIGIILSIIAVITAAIAEKQKG